jgi:hypothetical protein
MPDLRTAQNDTAHRLSRALPNGWSRWFADQGSVPDIGPVGEFIDALNALQRGHVLVNVSDSSCGWLLNGAVLYTAHRPLVHYELAESYENAEGFVGVTYYRITARGRAVAQRALAQWARLPLTRRLWLRAVA